MKMTRFITILFQLVAFHFLLPSFAQDYTQWGLPEGALYRIGKGNISGVKFTSDGNRLIVDTKIGLWDYDVHTGIELDFIPEDRWYSIRLGSSLGISPDGKRYITFDSEDIFTIRNLGDRTAIYTIEEPTIEIQQVAFSQDGNILAVGNKNVINLWDLTTGIKINTLIGHTGWIREITFNPNGSIIASVDSENVLQLWDVGMGIPISVLSTYIYRVNGLSFTPDGDTLLLSSQGSLLSWDVSTGNRNFDVFAGSVNSIAFSPEGNLISTSGQTGLKLWDGTTGNFITELGNYEWGNNAISFSPDGKTIACGGIDGLTIWDTEFWEPKLTIEGHLISMQEIDFHPNRNLMVSISSRRIHFWNTNTWTENNEFHIERYAHQFGLDINPYGTTLVTTVHGSIVLWEISSGTPLAILHSLESENWTRFSGFSCVEFSSDGNLLAGGNYNNTIQLWYEGRTRKGILTGHTAGITSITFHPNNRILASGSGDKTIKLWDVDAESHLLTLNGHTEIVNCVAFNPDGTYLASGSEDKSIILWDIDTGNYLQTFIGHTDEVVRVAFSPDGNTLASCSKREDPTVRLWDVHTGELKKTYTGHVEQINDIGFSPDGETLVSASYDGTLLVWDFNEFGNSAEQLVEDVNKDGHVNIQDLIYVASNIGQSSNNNPADVNGDETITIEDLLIVAAALQDVGDAPAKFQQPNPILSALDVEQWLDNSKYVTSNLPVYQKGRIILETLLSTLIPSKTMLLKNYPNPFNPETWIPFQLHQPADVSINIYSTDGNLVRSLKLGYKSSGIYQDIRKAAYWDGMNETGEPVASGVYFYTMKAGTITTTKRMVIRK
ncbi:PD40 domain-containing protein [Candidatus Poribacteria bacterium]|nr:PD40 domain-containing protein [Candidatus Poribacteria bacterium]